MELSTVLSILGLVLGGGGIGWYFNYLINNRQADQSQFDILIQRWEKDNERLRQREQANAIEIKKLQEELITLKNKMIMLESAHFDLPLPQWLKDIDGSMLSVNAEYERVFLDVMGVRAIDYIGKTDEDIWGKEIAEVYSKTDKTVYRTRKPMHVIENIPDGAGGYISYEVFKYPRFSGNVIIGIGGIALKEVKV
jgi:hypothetical protein